MLPCYNPPEGWADIVINNVRDIEQHISAPVEVILVNDGSVRGLESAHIEKLTRELPRFICIQHHTNQGKGATIRTGVAAASMETVIYTDVDFPYTTAGLVSVYMALAAGKADMVMGIKDPDYYSHVPAARRMISKLLRSMIKLFIRIPVTDTQCGLKGFRSKIRTEFLSTTINRYLFDLEFVYKLYRDGYKVLPVEVSLKQDVVFSRMNYKLLFPEILNFIRVMARMR